MDGEESGGSAAAAIVLSDIPTTLQTSSLTGGTSGVIPQDMRRVTIQDSVHTPDGEPVVHHILGEPEDRVQRLLKQLELPNRHLNDVQRTRPVELTLMSSH